jgi:hypothetical protein
LRAPWGGLEVRKKVEVRAKLDEAPVVKKRTKASEKRAY